MQRILHLISLSPLPPTKIKEKKLRIIILSQQGCSKCKALAARFADAEVVELQPSLLLQLARELNIHSLPIVLLSGDNHELEQFME